MRGRRDQQLHFRVSKPELDRIQVKMAELGIVSIGAYLRKMALDGYCIRLDLKELNRMAYLLQMCSNNLNQYAKRANESGRVYQTDIEDLRARLDELIGLAKTNFGAAGRPMSRNILAKAAAYFYTANGLKRVCKIKGQQGGPDEWIVILCAFSTVTFCLKEQK